MRQVSNQKIKYAVSSGVIALVTALLCVFCLPEYYSRWQDSKILGQVYTENWQTVQLPQADTQIQEKIRLLTEAENFEALAVFDFTEEDGNSGDLEEMLHMKECLNACVEEWISFGLLPEVFGEEYRECSLEKVVLYRIEEEEMSLYWIRLGNPADGTNLGFVMDMEGTDIYAVSVSTDPKAAESRLKKDGKWIWQQSQSELYKKLAEFYQADTLINVVCTENGSGRADLIYADFVSFVRSDWYTMISENETLQEGFTVAVGNPKLLELGTRFYSVYSRN